MTSWLRKSRPVSGSSSTTSLGSVVRARAMSTSWNWPPLISLQGLSASSQAPIRLSARSATATSSALGWANVPTWELRPMTAMSSPVKPYEQSLTCGT